MRLGRWRYRYLAGGYREKRNLHALHAHPLRDHGEYRLFVEQLLLRLQPERIGQHLPGCLAHRNQPGGYLPGDCGEFHPTSINTQHRHLSAPTTQASTSRQIRNLDLPGFFLYQPRKARSACECVCFGV